MAVCLNASEDEQIELILEDGRKIIVLPIKLPGRSLANVKIAFVAPKSIGIKRVPRKTAAENHKDID